MKLPYMQFYTGDWAKDSAVSMCSPATRGIWIDLICAMHDREQVGNIAATIPQLSRIARCTPAEMTEALAELKTSGCADVTDCCGVVTVVNRRMAREYKERNGSRLRMERSRASRNGCAPVTPYSSESESESERGEQKSESKPPVGNGAQGNVTGTSPAIERISAEREMDRRGKELDRVEKEIERIRGNYASHETMETADRLKLASLRERKAELLVILGMKV